MAYTKTDLEAIVVGAGVSGIAAACRLQMDLGLHNIKIFERDVSWGGTWIQNQYPGCACDIPTRLYSLSFAQRRNWKKFFSDQAEILDYLTDVADRFKLNSKAHFQHEVLEARFDEQNAHWVVRVRDLNDKTGKGERTYTARVLFTCVGALSVPRKCDVPGSENFKGPLFHSARWRKDVDVTNKRVVVLGNGCTASQIVPSIAPKVKQLTQIVRAKHWYLPHFRSPFDNPVARFLARNSQLWCDFERFNIVLLCESHFLQTFKRDGAGARKRVADRSIDYIKRCAPEEYHDLLIPQKGEVEVACKRRIFDSTYIPSLSLPNVELTRDQAAEIVEDGVILRSGRKVEADVLILANGFQTDQFALQMDIINGQGRSLLQYWRQDTGAPQAYRSEMVAPFPNLFVIWGPNSITGHFSAIWSQERAVEMATRILRPVFLTGNKRLSPIARSHGKSVRVKQSAEDFESEYNQTLMKDMIFSSGCGSWYVDEATGRVSAVNPCFQTTVAVRAKFPHFPDYEYRGVKQNEAWKSWTLMTRIGSVLQLGATPDLQGYGRRSLPVRILLFPWWLFKYLLRRSAVFALRIFSWLLDVLMPFNRPEKPTFKISGEAA